MNNYILPNIIYDEAKSESSLEDLISNISWANGYVLNGQKIIDRGEIIDENTYNILSSLEKEWAKRSDSIQEKRLTIAGQVLFVSLFIFCFMCYLELFRKDFYDRKGSLSLLFILIIFFPVLSSIIVEQNLASIYIIPFAMIPIIVRIFLDSRFDNIPLILETPDESLWAEEIEWLKGVRKSKILLNLRYIRK